MRVFTVLILAAALGACATSLDTHVDHDPRQVFTAYHTYAWIRDDPQIRAAGSDYQVSALNRRRVVEAVDAELAAKGFAKVMNRESADFTVAYTIGARDKIDAQSYPAPYDGRWNWGRRYFGQEVNIQSYVEDTLAIDIFDRRSHQPVWHGWAKKRVTAEDKERAEEQINAAVKTLLKDFPPR